MPQYHLKRNHMLHGTAEKAVLVMLWILLAVSIPHLVVQVIVCCLGLIGHQWFLRYRCKQGKMLVIGLSFILAGSCGLVFEIGNENTNALFSFEFLDLWWNITQDGLFYSALIAIKAINGLLAIQFAMQVFTFEEAITLAKKMKVPDVLIEMIFLSYRYLHGVQSCAKDIMISQRRRMGYKSFRVSLKSFSSMLSTVFIKSLRDSMQNYQAMTVRGYQGVIYTPTKWINSSPITILIIIFLTIALYALSFKYCLQTNC